MDEKDREARRQFLGKESHREISAAQPWGKIEEIEKIQLFSECVLI